MYAPHLLLSDHPLCRGLNRLRREAEHLVHLKPLGNLVGDEQHGDLALEGVHGGGEALRGLLVEVGDRLVENEDAGPFQQRPRNGDALTLASGEAYAVFPDLGPVSLGQAFDELVNTRLSAGLDNLLETGMGVGVTEVVVDGSGEEDRLLGHHAEDAPQFVGRHVADVAAVDEYPAVRGEIKPKEQLGQGALAAAGGTHHDRNTPCLEG